MGTKTHGSEQVLRNNCREIQDPLRNIRMDPDSMSVELNTVKENEMRDNNVIQRLTEKLANSMASVAELTAGIHQSNPLLSSYRDTLTSMHTSVFLVTEGNASCMNRVGGDLNQAVSRCNYLLTSFYIFVVPNAAPPQLP